ncbi:sensor histidine kinase [Streptomyces sp. NPDC060243]|uniref:sensor histidine kinase n=1 Tax=Streptomyces sp. NPDC060243 TaxID=3347081 RepID=UPI00365350CD
MGWLGAGLVGIVVLPCAVLALLWRRAVRRHRMALGERGWLLARERESAAKEAVRAERERIAAELHDIVSHNVSLMVVQASAAREILTTLPEEAARAMAEVEGAGRAAMTELRTLLGLLAPSQDGTEGGADLPLVPQPGLGRLGALVDRVAFSGLPVETRVTGEARELPAGVDVTAYRVVQEALTNALRHGGSGGRATVLVRYTERWLRIEVLNSAREEEGARIGGRAGGADGGADTGAARFGEGAGRGLSGLRERVAVYGGDLHAARRLGGGWRVRARLPLERG